MKKLIESSICKGLGIGESLHCFTPFRFIAIWGLGVGESLHCFTPFRFIAIWGRGGDCSIASLRSASSRFGEGEGIAPLLHFVPLHRDLGKGRGSLHCFTSFRFIAIWGRGGDRSIASLHSASSRFGEGEGIALLLHFVPLHRDLGKGRGSLYCFTSFRFIAILVGGLAEAISRKPSAIIPPYGSSVAVHNMETINIAKRNFPSCSLCSQFTASQKLPLLFPNAKDRSQFMNH